LAPRQEKRRMGRCDDRHQRREKTWLAACSVDISRRLLTQDTAHKKYEITYLSLPLPCRRIPLHRRHRRRTMPCPSAALILRKLPSPRPAAAEVCVNIQLPRQAEIRGSGAGNQVEALAARNANGRGRR
jgi:hypothetical protein